MVTVTPLEYNEGVSDRSCVQCGARTPRREAKFCSRACMADAFRGPVTCSVDGCTNRCRARGLCTTHYNQQRYTPDQRHRPDSKPSDPEAKRLSDLAHHKRRRALLQGATAERIHRHEIAERDGWTCWLCHKRVNPKVRWPDVMCASIDHVVPLSCGGDHTWANVRLAHFRCNVARGNRAHGEQLSLIG